MQYFPLKMGYTNKRGSYEKNVSSVRFRALSICLCLHLARRNAFVYCVSLL